MRKHYQKYYLDALIEDVWDAFVEESEFERWSGRNASIYNDENRPLEMNFDGIRIRGVSTNLDHRKRIEQEWVFMDRDWVVDETGEALKTQVTIVLHEMSDRTMLEVTVEPFPDERYDEIERLWRERIVDKMNASFRKNRK